jgi:hypothetical protein
MFQVFFGVSYVYLQVFNLDVAYVCNGFQMFLGRFRKCFRRLFQVFYVFFCMLQLLHMNISKVAQVMGCAWEVAGRRTTFGQCGPIAGGLAREPDALDAYAFPVRAASGR